MIHCCSGVSDESLKNDGEQQQTGNNLYFQILSRNRGTDADWAHISTVKVSVVENIQSNANILNIFSLTSDASKNSSHWGQ